MTIRTEGTQVVTRRWSDGRQEYAAVQIPPGAAPGDIACQVGALPAGATVVAIGEGEIRFRREPAHDGHSFILDGV